MRLPWAKKKELSMQTFWEKGTLSKPRGFQGTTCLNEITLESKGTLGTPLLQRNPIETLSYRGQVLGPQGKSLGAWGKLGAIRIIRFTYQVDVLS